MAHTSYLEADAEEAGIKAHYVAMEKARKAKLTVEELVMEGLVREEMQLKIQLQKLRDIAARIPRTENQIVYHREKMAKWKEKYGL